MCAVLESLEQGGALVRTGMPAQPSWCKAQPKPATETTIITSESNLRRCFFDTFLNKPGYNTGLYNVRLLLKSQLNHQLSQPNQLMVGFFDDSDIDPATAGFIHVLAKYKTNNNPACSRDFYCTSN